MRVSCWGCVDIPQAESEPDLELQVVPRADVLEIEDVDSSSELSECMTPWREMPRELDLDEVLDKLWTPPKVTPTPKVTSDELDVECVAMHHCRLSLKRK